MSTEYRIGSLTELEQLAQELLGTISPSPDGATILALNGDLGAGKTTFVQALARQMGVVEVVTSPTYLIMRQYATTDPRFPLLVHMDAYRIEDVGELVPLRFSDVLTTPGTLVCVEWAEKIADALPASVRTLTFVTDEHDVRTIVDSN